MKIKQELQRRPAPGRNAFGLNSITILVLPIVAVFVFSIGLCVRELAAHFVAGDGDGAMLTHISDNSPMADSGYDRIARTDAD